MLNYIEFKADRFKKEDDYNLLCSLTNNVIIICNNYKIMDSLAKEIVNTVNSKAEYNDYCCDDKDLNKAKIVLQFGLQRVIDINGQRITLALEPAIVYKAKSVNDIWFFDCVGNEDDFNNNPYEEYIYPLTLFKGHEADWKDGLDEIYKNVCNGVYGTYDGKWVKDGIRLHSIAERANGNKSKSVTVDEFRIEEE